MTCAPVSVAVSINRRVHARDASAPVQLAALLRRMGVEPVPAPASSCSHVGAQTRSVHRRREWAASQRHAPWASGWLTGRQLSGVIGYSSFVPW